MTYHAMFDLTLSFDNGPEPDVTPKVLDILARRNIKTTFFVIGEKLARPECRKLAERAKEEGRTPGYDGACRTLSAEQSLASGLVAYRPGAGLRSWGGAITYRHEFSDAWASFVSLNYSRLAGPALDSPLTLKPGAAWVSGGLAWRF